MKTWVKWYTEVNHDPKIGRMSWELKGIWAALVALGGEIDDLDADGQPTGRLDTIEDVAWQIRCDADLLQRALDVFCDADHKMIEVRDGIIYIVNYAKRQARFTSETPAAVGKRVKEYRARVTPPAQLPCNDNVTTLQEIVTDCNDSRIEKNRVEENRTEKIQNDSPKKRARSENQQAQDAMIEALAEVCNRDARLQSQIKVLSKYAKELLSTQHTPAQVRRIFGEGGWWYLSDWRGKKNQPPAPQHISEVIAQAIVSENGGNGNGRRDNGAGETYAPNMDFG